jgi:hypothetical protein
MGSGNVRRAKRITMEGIMVENLELGEGEEVILDVHCGCLKPKEDYATKSNDGFMHEVGAFATNDLYLAKKTGLLPVNGTLTLTNRRIFWQAVDAQIRAPRPGVRMDSLMSGATQIDIPLDAVSGVELQKHVGLTALKVRTAKGELVFTPPQFTGDVPERLQQAIESLRRGESVAPNQHVSHAAGGEFTRRGLPMKWLWVAIGVGAFILVQILKQ